MRYSFRAINQQGLTQKGEIVAASEAEVLDYLRRLGYTPIAIRAKQLGVLGRFFGRFFGRLSIEERVFLSRNLSLMIHSGLDLNKSISILIEDLPEGGLKNFLLYLRFHLEHGQPVYRAFEVFAHTFSPIEIQLIKAGETSGNLEKALTQITRDLEREREIRSEIISSMIYPLLLIATAAGIVILMSTFVMPRIARVVLESGQQLPFFSRMIISVSIFIGNNIWPLLFGGVFLIAGSIFTLMYTRFGQKLLHRFMTQTPIIRHLVLLISLRNFSYFTATLMEAGVPLNTIFRLIVGTIPHPEMKIALQHVNERYLPRGATLGEAFGKEPVFPKILVTLIGVGERSGNLVEILNTLGAFYQFELETRTKNLVNLVGPVILLLIGVMVAVLAISVILPIYQQINAQIGRGATSAP